MQKDEVQAFRRARLEAAAGKAGSKAALGRLLGYLDGAMVGQMLRGERPITEGTVAKLEAKAGFRGWFSQAEPSSPSNIGMHPAEEQLLEDVRALLPEDRVRFLEEIHARAEQMREHEKLVLERVGVKRPAPGKERAHSEIVHTPKSAGGVTYGEGRTANRPRTGKLLRK